MSLQPKLPITVDLALWHQVAEVAGAPFADSYLSGATHEGRALTPRTVFAHDKLMSNRAVVEVFEGRDVAVVRPLHFGHPGRPDTVTASRRMEPWRPLTDDEFERASLSAKIDHHKNMQLRAEMKAGPMWRGGLKGRPAPPDELGPDWHHWSAKAKNHAAEASRLGTIMREATEQRR